MEEFILDIFLLSICIVGGYASGKAYAKLLCWMETRKK